MLNIFSVGMGPQIFKTVLAMGVTIRGDAAKSGKSTILLVIMHARLSQKICLLDLKNKTLFKKENSTKQRTKSLCNYCRIRIMLHTLYYYYTHTNIDLLGV